MFKTRLLSGIVLVAILLAGILLGNWVFWALILFVSLVGLYELYKLEHIEKTPMYAAAVIGTVIYALALKFNVFWGFVIFVFFGLFIALAMIYVLTFPKYKATQFILAFFSFFYVPVMLFCLYLIRSMPHGILLIWLVIIASWGCDTGAYCVGMRLGKHKLAPVLSPKKSIEGAVGGVVVSAVIGLIFSLIFGNRMDIFAHPVAVCVIISVAGAVLSQFGDLTASAIKRHYEIKDYGTLIPGHGGIMDRFDSVIFISPVIYMLLVAFTLL